MDNLCLWIEALWEILPLSVYAALSKDNIKCLAKYICVSLSFLLERHLASTLGTYGKVGIADWGLTRRDPKKGIVMAMKAVSATKRTRYRTRDIPAFGSPCFTNWYSIISYMGKATAKYQCQSSRIADCGQSLASSMLMKWANILVRPQQAAWTQWLKRQLQIAKDNHRQGYCKIEQNWCMKCSLFAFYEMWAEEQLTDLVRAQDMDDDEDMCCHNTPYRMPKLHKRSC